MSLDIVTVLTPLYNDWGAACSLIKRIDSVCGSWNARCVRILIVDDASQQDSSHELENLSLSNIESVEVLRLVRNLGHQRAIAVGLTSLFEERAESTVVVMDGDGEDNPDDIADLLAAIRNSSSQKIVFAERTIRSEGRIFCFFYQLYRFVHYMLTGRQIRFGNFSAIPPRLLHPIVTVPDLWNHYAASVISAKIPYTLIATTRAKRYGGDSKMNFISLVTHGLGAISAHRELVCARTLMIISSAVALSVTYLACTLFSLGRRASTAHIGPLVALAILLIATLLSIGLVLIFVTLGNRNRASFIPIRDCGQFVAYRQRRFIKTQE
jgi:glycosyltransferase involved in cell wall biosynthesis